MVVLVPAIFKTHLHSVLTLHPSQVVRKLPTVICLEAELAPAVVTYRVILNAITSGNITIAAEINSGRPTILSHKSTNALRLIGSRSARPKNVRPAGTCGEWVTPHEPAVPSNCGVI